MLRYPQPSYCTVPLSLRICGLFSTVCVNEVTVSVVCSVLKFVTLSLMRRVITLRHESRLIFECIPCMKLHCPFRLLVFECAGRDIVDDYIEDAQ